MTDLAPGLNKINQITKQKKNKKQKANDINERQPGLYNRLI